MAHPSMLRPALVLCALGLGACSASTWPQSGAEAGAPSDTASDAPAPADARSTAGDASAGPETGADAGPEASADAGPCNPGLARGTGRWEVVPSGTTLPVVSISGTDCRHVYAAVSSENAQGMSSQLLRWDGATWTPRATGWSTPGRAYLNAVWVAGPEDVWLGGGYRVSTSGTVERWQGSPTSSFDFAANAVWGSGPNDVWFAGGYGGALHWNGSSYDRLSGSGLGTPLEQLFFRGAITGLWGAEGELWFVGLATQAQGSLVRRRSDGTFETLHATPTNLLAVWGSSAHDVWAVGDAGAAAHWDGAAWTAIASGVRVPLYGLWGSGPNDVWAVGASGSILRWRGANWEVASRPTMQTLHAVWGSGPEDVWAVGDGGTILHWGG